MTLVTSFDILVHYNSEKAYMDTFKNVHNFKMNGDTYVIQFVDKSWIVLHDVSKITMVIKV